MTTSPEDILRSREMYVAALADLADRIDAARRFVALGDPPHVRAGASELRGCLELLIYTGLLTHRELLGEAESALRGANWKRARQLVKAANANWWPQPVTIVKRPGKPWDFLRREQGEWLREDEWDAEYQRTSTLLHVRNPFVAERPSVERGAIVLDRLANKLATLITAHAVKYSDESFLLAQVGPNDGSSESRVLCNWWERTT